MTATRELDQNQGLQLGQLAASAETIPSDRTDDTAYSHAVQPWHSKDTSPVGVPHIEHGSPRSTPTNPQP